MLLLDLFESLVARMKDELISNQIVSPMLKSSDDAKSSLS